MSNDVRKAMTFWIFCFIFCIISHGNDKPRYHRRNKIAFFYFVVETDCPSSFEHFFGCFLLFLLIFFFRQFCRMIHSLRVLFAIIEPFKMQQ